VNGEALDDLTLADSGREDENPEGYKGIDPESSTDETGG